MTVVDAAGAARRSSREQFAAGASRRGAGSGRHPAGPPPRTRIAPDEAAARSTLRGQIAKLECELAQLAARTVPADAIIWSIGAPGARGPRLLDLGELERVRDDLAERLHEVRVAHDERAEREALKRNELERMLRDPAAHPYKRIRLAELGRPGCGAYESRPRLGLIGMLAGWWHVKLSSGCPLAGPA